MGNIQKEVQSRLTKGLLDLIVLQFINSQPMHGYQVITKIRRSFGVYFGPSTVYPLLASLEKKGHVSSSWNMEGERPRKVYEITNEGKNMLHFTENSLNIICKTMSKDTKPSIALLGVGNNESDLGCKKGVGLISAHSRMT
jgi:PadR family transcriptional regulator PadR